MPLYIESSDLRRNYLSDLGKTTPQNSCQEEMPTGCGQSAAEAEHFQRKLELLDPDSYGRLGVSAEPELMQLNKKMGKNEKIVRNKLVEVWNKLLEKYVKPGVPIPSVESARAELFHVGVEAGVKAVVEKNWFLFSFMVRDEIEHEVNKGLNQLDIPLLLDYLKKAQQDPKLIDFLRGQIRHYVLG